MAKDLKIRLVLKFFVNPQHLLLHHGTDGRATGKKEIRHVNFTVYGLVIDQLSLLVVKGEGSNCMVNRILTDKRIPRHRINAHYILCMFVSQIRKGGFFGPATAAPANENG